MSGANKIVLMNPFSPDLITGGIKTTYSHAEILARLGFCVEVFQPVGVPGFLNEAQRPLVVHALSMDPGDVVVFPETINGWIRDFAFNPSVARKVMFCQNQYYLYTYGVTRDWLKTACIDHIIVPGHQAKRELCSVMGLEEDGVHVVPISVDPDLFRPATKEARVVTAPRKWPFHDGLPAQAGLIENIVKLKYPSLGDVPWVLLENMQPDQVAAEMGRADLFLSLCRMEANPLTPLEAMASGCIVVGYHGTGGLEYATHRNGFWLSPEQFEEVADAIARVLTGLRHDDPTLKAMREDGYRTAAMFNQKRTEAALQEVYGSLML
jgi:glycosyltransferase involved in cell wall biosynthesis